MKFCDIVIKFILPIAFIKREWYILSRKLIADTDLGTFVSIQLTLYLLITGLDPR